MAEYIDRKALIEHLEKDPLYDLVEQYGVTGVIESFPAADIQPVKHGRWINTMPNVEYKSFCQVKCSVCESIEPYGNFCRNCGADMRGE